MKRRSFIKSLLSALGALFAPAFVPRKADATMYLAPFMPTYTAGLTNAQDFAQLGERIDVPVGAANGDGPTNFHANHAIDFKWPTNSNDSTNPNDTPPYAAAPWGSWIDAAGVQRGFTPFASATIPSSGALPLSITFDITSLMRKLMLQNTGVYITPETAGIGAAAGFASMQWTGDPAQKPTFRVVTSVGTYDVPALVDSQIVTSSNDAGMDPYMRDPYCIKPDLSTVEGALISATLTLWDVTGSQLRPCRYDCYYLDMPKMIHDPARQLGGVVQGIAATVTTDDRDLASHPSVIFYPSFANQAACEAAGWDNLDFSANKPNLSPGGGFVPWTAYGLTALRMTSLTINSPGVQDGDGSGSTILSWRRYFRPDPNKSVGLYTELWARWLIRIDPDVFIGMFSRGMKLQGFEGWYQDPGIFSYRMNHEKQSVANRGAYSFWIHAYDADNPVPLPGFADNRSTGNCALVEGRIYCIEQHVKLNTKTGSTWNRDGVLEVWLDGVLVSSRHDMYINDNDASNAHGINNYFANFYHGGLDAPRAPIHYEFGGVCIATQYIGPPKIPTPYTIPAQGHFKNISLNTVNDVEACPGHNCVYWAAAGVNAMFSTWNGGAYDKDYSPLGALLICGGGHPPTGYSGNEAYAFDLFTARWELCRQPSLYNISTDADANYEYPDGQPAPSHSYSGMECMPSEWFGGTRGKLLRFGVAGGAGQWIRALDLSNVPNASWVKLNPNPVTIGGNLAQYYMAVRDDGRQGFWVCNVGSGDKTAFVTKTGKILYFNVGNSFIGRGGVAYSPTLDLLVVKSASLATYPNTQPSLSVMRANDPYAGWTNVNWSGTGPGGAYFGMPSNDADPTFPQYDLWQKAGLTWSSILGKFVSYQGAGSSTVYFLTPPADPINSTWIWTSETLIGDSGAVPSNNGLDNGHWGGRFKEIPKLRCFVWADSASQPVQLWRPTGMV